MTEREMVERERRAVARTAEEMFRIFGLSVDRPTTTPRGWEGSLTLANRLYPLPKVTRPRVVRDTRGSGLEWRSVDGRLQYRDRDAGGGWRPESEIAISPDPDRVAMWSSLLASPTETVDA